jgi:glycosyltransferase involved in cell wall biosynthesis
MYEKKTYFSDSTVYDLAISYDMGKECAIFTDQYVDATHKYTFLHSSDLEKSKLEAFAKFDKIIGVNAGVAANVTRAYPFLESKMASIENFISPETITCHVTDLAPKAAKTQRFEICTCGNLNRVKGQDIAIEAAKMLSDAGLDFTWTFVGDGEDRPLLEQKIAQYGLSDKITITGFQTNPYTYIKRCDLYVQPSKEEAHATTLIEALILGKPIISTNTIAGTYILSKYPGGILVNIDATMLAEKVRFLLENSDERQKLATATGGIDWEKRRLEYANDINTMLAEKI